MKKCLVVLTAVVALVLFAPMANASYIECGEVSSGTATIAQVTITCPSFTLPAGQTLYAIDLQLQNDASGGILGTVSTIEWDWMNLEVAGNTGSSLYTTQEERNQESDTTTSVSFSTCIVQQSFTGSSGCDPSLLTVGENITGAAGGTLLGTTSVKVNAFLVSGPGLQNLGITDAYFYVQYDTTPEPATFGLIGGALLGLGIFGSKKLARR